MDNALASIGWSMKSLPITAEYNANVSKIYKMLSLRWLFLYLPKDKAYLRKAN